MAKVIINGRVYGSRYDLSAQERVEEEFGDLKTAFAKMKKTASEREALDAVKKMFVIMANCERDFRGEPEDVTAEALKHAPMSVISQLGAAIVDAIQAAYGVFDGIVINPAAYTHTSVAILDALKAVALPAVEVHLSDVSLREDFRRISYAGMACQKTFMGLGFEGYRQAILFLKDYLEKK